MKLTATLSSVYKEKFKEVLLPLGFKLKGSLFIRVINEEIIQTVNTFKNSPFDFTLNIGILPFSRDNEKELLKEGNYRLYDFVGYDLGEFHYHPLKFQSIKEVVDECVVQFKKGVLPIFESVQTEEDYLSFEEQYEMNRYGEYSYLGHERMVINLKLRNYSEVLKGVEAYWKQNVDAITSNYQDGDVYDFKNEEEFQAYLRGELQLWTDIKKAIAEQNITYLDNLVETNRQKSRKILKDYGFVFKNM
ncbi:hypothetical protein CN514_22755 [Bacillus sp. AFS001701]|uniref:DUF4304 domain-containing protein n=1 Tax=Bacillus sp. AFS001701 TaxID=2033480 RepID=UPI000BF39455|nr:DUF4304 domain-containing protein [Bacillus sp. AFS001701]PET42344.1 hypothetical protein CN514_22755 [Bacillus sp. AFS001701]